MINPPASMAIQMTLIAFKATHDALTAEAQETLAAAVVAMVRQLHPAAPPKWVVNDNGELGVEVGGRFHWLYKGASLEYEDAAHDDGSPMFYRPVYKREFGECCHPETGFWIEGLERRWPPMPWRGGEPDHWSPLPRSEVPS